MFIFADNYWLFGLTLKGQVNRPCMYFVDLCHSMIQNVYRWQIYVLHVAHALKLSCSFPTL